MVKLANSYQIAILNNVIAHYKVLVTGAGSKTLDLESKWTHCPSFVLIYWYFALRHSLDTVLIDKQHHTYTDYKLSQRIKLPIRGCHTPL